MPEIAMERCILHVGMPKTGTSSIQETLCHSLRDPRFRYISLESGRTATNRALTVLFADPVEGSFLERPSGREQSVNRRLLTRLERSLTRTLAQTRRQQAIPILSAETCWVMGRSGLDHLRTFMEAQGYRVEVMVYLRPIKSWLESIFQEMVKWGQGSFEPLNPLSPHQGDKLSRIDYNQRLSIFEDIFGKQHLSIHPFSHESLVGHCVVTDFCSKLGIQLDPEAIRRANEGIGIDAVRMLYAYNRYGPDRDQPGLKNRAVLWQRLQAMGGESLRFHSTVLAPIQAEINAQHLAIGARLGIPFGEDLFSHDERSCIREESDLFRFSRPSLNWLASASGSDPVGGGEGPEVARQVSDQLHRLTRQPAWQRRLNRLKRRTLDQLQGMHHGT
jgi:hypothetical protein